jgi:predicted unusual protein kinase regulating ubiquinone biosynthesis (AarF/ABC1/UbiB family)
MVGEIVPDVRARLLDMFYAINRKDADGVVKTLTELGIIRATGDALSVKRAIAYFITSLTAQLERSEAVAAIGEDLFAIATDQPFRFPATFTFVLRAFSTLEGIGKTLNPKYSFGAVAAPYAQELLQLQGAGAQGTALMLLRKQASEMSSAAVAVPTRVARIDGVITQLESGDLKLRVRVLEAERAAKRTGVMQTVTLHAVGAVGFLNLGAMASFASQIEGSGASAAGGAALAIAGVFGVLTLLGLKRVQRLDKFEKELRQ